MAPNNNTEIQPSSDSAKHPIQTNHSKLKGTAPVNSKKFFWPLLSTLLALIALVIALYAIYSGKQEEKARKKLIGQIRQDLTQAQSANQEVLRAGIGQAQSSMQSQLKTLSTSIQNTLAQGQFQRADWLLLEARYYLELAQIHAYW